MTDHLKVGVDMDLCYLYIRTRVFLGKGKTDEHFIFFNNCT